MPSQFSHCRGPFEVGLCVILVASWNWEKLRDTSRLDVVRAVAH